MLELRRLLSGVAILGLAGEGSAVAGNTPTPVDVASAAGSPSALVSHATIAPTQATSGVIPLPSTTPTTSPDGADAVPAAVVAQPVQVYSWAPPRDPSSFQGMIWASYSSDPLAAARFVAPKLAARAPGQRVLMLSEAMNSAFASYDPANPAAFIASGWNITHDQQWSQSFFGALQSMGVSLDRVVTDVEIGFSTWSLFRKCTSEMQNVPIMQGIYSNFAAYSKLSADVKAYTPQDFGSQFTDRGHKAFIAWNTWERSVFAQAYKSAIADPLHAALGPNVLISNYGDMLPRTKVLDRNGWPAAEPSNPIGGNVNSPELYLWNGLEFRNLKKDWRWNRLIDTINTARACQNVPNTTVTPWISLPRFTGDNTPQAKATWLWEQMVRHLVAGGISAFIYWNPVTHTDRGQDQFADTLFKSLTVGVPTQQSLQPIPFDADSITTNGFTTTYADFLRFVNDPTATNIPNYTPPAPVHDPSTPTRQPALPPLQRPMPRSPVSPSGVSAPALQSGAPVSTPTFTGSAGAQPTTSGTGIITNQKMGLTSLYEWLNATNPAE